MDALDIVMILMGAACGLLALVYLLYLLGSVVRGAGLALGEVVVKVVIIVALGWVTWALLGLGGVL